MADFIMPDNSQSITVIGRKGSGKTQVAMWHLAMRDFKIPWIVINHKKEKMVDEIPYAKFMTIDKFIPKNASGVYIYHPKIGEEDLVTELLFKIYDRENCGVYVDEGTMIPRNDKGMNNLWTQGRSKNIPLIFLSQRPSGITRLAISEADFFNIMQITDARDRKVVNEFINFDLNKILAAEGNKPSQIGDYHSLHYDVKQNRSFILQPVPDKNIILAMLEKKLRPKTAKTNLI
jgi:hypothetical protein